MTESRCLRPFEKLKNHSHNDKVANIIILPPKSWICQHRKVTNITFPSTTLSTYCFAKNWSPILYRKKLHEIKKFSVLIFCPSSHTLKSFKNTFSSVDSSFIITVLNIFVENLWKFLFSEYILHFKISRFHTDEKFLSESVLVTSVPFPLNSYRNTNKAL